MFFGSDEIESNSVVSLETLHRYHKDTGLPIDMITTLLEEAGIRYNQEEVMRWMNEEGRVREGTQSEMRGIPHISELEQRVDSDGMMRWDPTPCACSVIYDDGESLLLDPCPFYPTQAGQEGDVGVLVTKRGSIPVKRTVRRSNHIVCQVGAHTPLMGESVECRVDAEHRQ